MSFIADYNVIVVIIILIAFIFKLLDVSLGVGFGTAITPTLLIIGYSVGNVVPSVLLAELCAGCVAMIFHFLFRNIKLGQKRVFKLKRRKADVYKIPNSELIKSSKIVENNNDEVLNKDDDIIIEEEIVVDCKSELDLSEDDVIEEINLENGSIINRLKNLTTDTKIIFILSFFGIIAAVFAAVINVIFDYNEWYNFSVEIYIGLMVLGMGILSLVFRNKQMSFSIKRISGLGAFAGFNKGISGGGYTPITVLGQLLTGREGRNALAATTYSKTAISFIGISAYILTHIIQSVQNGIAITWEYLDLAPWLIIGAIIAAPIGALITRKVRNKGLKIALSSITILLGVFCIIRISLLQVGIWEKIPSFIDILMMK